MRYFSLLLAFIAVATATGTSAQSPSVETIAIGSPEPDARSWANAINSRSVVVVTTENRNFPIWRYRIYTWTRTGGFRLVMENAQATDINDRGVITGVRRLCAYDERCEQRGFSWSASAGATDLGTFWPYAINNLGNMVGFVRDVTGPTIRLNGELRRLPDGFIPIDINERNAVAGEDRVDIEQRVRHPAVWAPRVGLRRLDPRGREGSVTSINESGMVSGTSFFVDAGGTYRSNAALFTPLGPAVLATPPYANAEAVSDRGWIVGGVDLRPVLWLLGGRRVDLPTPGAPGGTAYDVNDAGYIIGRSTGGAANMRSYVWIVR